MLMQHLVPSIVGSPRVVRILYCKVYSRPTRGRVIRILYCKIYSRPRSNGSATVSIKRDSVWTMPDKLNNNRCETDN